MDGRFAVPAVVRGFRPHRQGDCVVETVVAVGQETPRRLWTREDIADGLGRLYAVLRDVIYPFEVMAPLLFRNRFRISTTRLQGWDYRWPGVYGVTICVQGRVCCLGEVVDADVALSPFGEIAAEEWQAIPGIHPHVGLDEWIVMPDHVHGILVFQGEQCPSLENRLTAGSLGAVVGQFKKRATKRIRARRRPEFSWQGRFFDQILKDQEALDHYRAYIRENPLRWQSPEQVVAQT
jgi:REP element-mobilizing transposase RayT